MTPERIERAARAIAAVNGDDFDAVPRDKSEWTEKRGNFAGRFRDVNEPTKIDYLAMAGVAAAELYPELASGTHWIAPMEATEGMKEAGGLSAYIDDWAGAVWQAMRDAHLKAQG